MDELPPPPPQPNQWAAPVPLSTPLLGTPSPQVKRSPAVKIAAILSAMLVVGAAIAGVQMALGNSKDASLPDAVGSYRRMNTAAIQQAHDAFHAQTKQSGFEADAAVYGAGSTPRFMLAWIRDATVNDPDTALTSLASGFAQAFGGNIATDQKRTQVVEGTKFVCAPITGSTFAAICLWQQREVFYILFDPGSAGNLNATLRLSATAQRAVG